MRMQASQLQGQWPGQDTELSHRDKGGRSWSCVWSKAGMGTPYSAASPMARFLASPLPSYSWCSGLASHCFVSWTFLPRSRLLHLLFLLPGRELPRPGLSSLHSARLTPQRSLPWLPVQPEVPPPVSVSSPSFFPSVIILSVYLSAFCLVWFFLFVCVFCFFLLLFIFFTRLRHSGSFHYEAHSFWFGHFSFGDVYKSLIIFA